MVQNCDHFCTNPIYVCSGVCMCAYVYVYMCVCVYLWVWGGVRWWQECWGNNKAGQGLGESGVRESLFLTEGSGKVSQTKRRRWGKADPPREGTTKAKVPWGHRGGQQVWGQGVKRAAGDEHRRVMWTTPCRALGPWQALCLLSERRVPWGGFEGRRDCISSGSNKVAQLLRWGLILRRLGCWWGDHSNGLAGDGGGLGPGSRGDGEEGSVHGQAVELESAGFTDEMVKAMWRRRQRLEQCGHKPRNAWSHQSWRRQGRGQSTSRGSVVADTGFATPGFRKKCETIRFCYFKVLSLWYFVMAASWHLKCHGKHLKK